MKATVLLMLLVLPQVAICGRGYINKLLKLLTKPPPAPRCRVIPCGLADEAGTIEQQACPTDMQCSLKVDVTFGGESAVVSFCDDLQNPVNNSSIFINAMTSPACELKNGTSLVSNGTCPFNTECKVGPLVVAQGGHVMSAKYCEASILQRFAGQKFESSESSSSKSSSSSGKSGRNGRRKGKKLWKKGGWRR